MAQKASPELTKIIVRNAKEKAAQASATGDHATADKWQQYADKVRDSAPIIPD